MSRPEITAGLAARLEKYIDPLNDPRTYWSKEVTFDYATEHPIRVDYMRFKPRNNSVSGIEAGDFYCFEIKSSVEDFNSKNGHNFLGDYNYYVMPEDVFVTVKNRIPYYVGVLTPDCFGRLALAKRAIRSSRSRPVSEVLLMMWRSSRREIVKARRAQQKEATP